MSGRRLWGFLCTSHAKRDDMATQILERSELVFPGDYYGLSQFSLIMCLGCVTRDMCRLQPSNCNVLETNNKELFTIEDDKELNCCTLSVVLFLPVKCGLLRYPVFVERGEIWKLNMTSHSFWWCKVQDTSVCTTLSSKGLLSAGSSADSCLRFQIFFNAAYPPWRNPKGSNMRWMCKTLH